MSVFRLFLASALLTTALPALAQPLILIEDRTFESNYGFMIAIPPGTTACRGGYTDHGFFLFLGPRAPCVRRTEVKDEDVPWVVERAPPNSGPYIQFSYHWNAAFQPESAFEVVEMRCQGGRVGVSSLRFMETPGIECLRTERASGYAEVYTLFHRFNIDPDKQWTDDDGYIVPVAHIAVKLVTTTRDLRKHRAELRRALNALSWPPPGAPEEEK